jgi:polysaccharide biosynthesis/export protein
VSGELKGTGVIEIEKGETLRQLVNRLGGPTSSGYLFALQLRRESVRRTQQQRLNEIADRFERDLEASASRRLTSTTDKDNLAIIAADLERQRALAQRLRNVRAEGRVILELEGGQAQVKDLPDFPLQNGDSVFVPQRPNTVDVMGAVFQQNSFIYRPQRSVADYLELAGGVTESADTSERYVIRADGTARAKGSGGWFGSFSGADSLNPGDTIVIPEKLQGNSWTQSLKEWTAIFYQFGLGAAGLKVLKN